MQRPAVARAQEQRPVARPRQRAVGEWQHQCLKGRIGLRCGHGLARGPREQGAILVPAAARNDAGGGCWWNPNAGFIDNERSEEHTSELQSLMRISYAVFCL